MANKQQLDKIKGFLESFFIEIRFNLGLHGVLNSQRFTEFNKVITKAVRDQIGSQATVERIDEMLIMGKAVGQLTETGYLDVIRDNWIPLLALVDETEFSNYLIWVANRGGQSALDKLSYRSTFDLKNKDVVDTISKHIKDVAEQVDGTTQNWIARTVEQGKVGGMTSREIARMLKDQSYNTADVRGDLISEHESAFIYGQTEMETYKRSGIKYVKWRTARDELVCSSCMANEEAGEVDVGEIFPSGTYAPPQHQRCRCMLVPIIPNKLKNIWTGK